MSLGPKSLNNVVTPEELGATRRGITLILGYLLEGIQNGTSRDGRLPLQHDPMANRFPLILSDLAPLVKKPVTRLQ
jgi:hypothetical protein